MTNEERDRRDRWRARIEPVIGALAVALLFALVLMMWQVTHDRTTAQQETATLADRVTAACDQGGEVATQLRKVGACQQAASVPAAQPGPAGPQGPRGEEGPKGDTGERGATGATGATGPQGPAGDAGVPGLLGPAGPIGQAGTQGAKGDTGDKGADGTSCLPSIPGCQGPEGPPGPTGPEGPAGPPCPEGYSRQDRQPPLSTETWLVCVKD
jgi:hypothetical protein